MIAYRSGTDYHQPPARGGSLGAGYYFTTNPERARKYASCPTCILSVNLRFRNPLSGPKKTLAESVGILDHLTEEGFYDNAVGEALNTYARKAGYDGIVALENNGKFYEIVAFHRHSWQPVRS